MARSGWFGQRKRHSKASIKGWKRKSKHRKRFDFPKGKGLNTRATIYVPSTTNLNKPISKPKFDRRIQNTQEYLTNKFGGTTKVSGFGTYTSEKGAVVGENVAKVEVFSDKKEYIKHDQDIEKWVNRKKKKWGQESMSYEYNGQMYFV